MLRCGQNQVKTLVGPWPLYESLRKRPMTFMVRCGQNRIKILVCPWQFLKIKFNSVKNRISRNRILPRLFARFSE